MYDRLLKDLLRVKINMADSIIELLPKKVNKHMKDVHKSIIKVVNEVTMEYLDDENLKKEKTGIKSINIE